MDSATEPRGRPRDKGTRVTDRARTKRTTVAAQRPAPRQVLVATHGWKSTIPDELTCKQGQEFYALNKDKPGWRFVESVSSGRRGFLPATHLTPASSAGAGQFANASTESASESALDDSQSRSSVASTDTADASNSESDSVSPSESESEADSESAEESESTVADSVPPTKSKKSKRPRAALAKIVTLPSKPVPPELRTSSVSPSKGRAPAPMKLPVRHALPDSRVDYEATLSAYGDLPSSYRVATLGKLSSKGLGSTSAALTPVVNENATGLANLAYKGQDLQPVLAKTTLAFSILEAKQMWVPGANIIVLGRLVRTTLFDKTAVLSNIHNVPARCATDNHRSWRFSSKSSLFSPRDDENTCLVRLDTVDFKLGLLFELSMLVAQPGRPETLTEVSAGWACLPLYTAEGEPADNRTYELRLHGGTPFDENPIEIQGGASPTRSIRPRLASLLTGDKTPRLEVKVSRLKSSQMVEINQLPSPLVTWLSAAPVLAAYRHQLLESLLSHTNAVKLAPHANVVLAIVPKILEESDLLQVLIHLWDQKLLSSRRSERRDAEAVKRKFIETVLEVWPCLFVYSIPGFLAGDDVRQQTRANYFAKIITEGPVAALTGDPGELSHAPFNVNEHRGDFLAAAL